MLAKAETLDGRGPKCLFAENDSGCTQMQDGLVVRTTWLLIDPLRPIRFHGAPGRSQSGFAARMTALWDRRAASHGRLNPFSPLTVSRRAKTFAMRQRQFCGVRTQRVQPANIGRSTPLRRLLTIGTTQPFLALSTKTGGRLSLRRDRTVRALLVPSLNLAL